MLEVLDREPEPSALRTMLHWPSGPSHRSCVPATRKATKVETESYPCSTECIGDDCLKYCYEIRMHQCNCSLAYKSCTRGGLPVSATYSSFYVFHHHKAAEVAYITQRDCKSHHIAKTKVRREKLLFFKLFMIPATEECKTQKRRHSCQS